MARLTFQRMFDGSDIVRFVNRKIENLEAILYEQIQIVGEQFVFDARSIDTYRDRTGNLRSSIGYIIFKDGVILKENFTGTLVGVETAKSRVRGFKKGFSLIVVAGMHYAGYVEAKGFDVITGSSLVASRNLRRAFERVQKGLNQLKRAA